jgi:formamidopyrimidine-DNA glycosylase-like protein
MRTGAAGGILDAVGRSGVAEGDSIARLAGRLHRQLAGAVVARSDVRHPRFAGSDLSGQAVTGWHPRGKHLLMRTDAGWTVHSHLRMSGRWSVLRPGRRLPVAADLQIALHLIDLILQCPRLDSVALVDRKLRHVGVVVPAWMRAAAPRRCFTSCGGPWTGKGHPSRSRFGVSQSSVSGGLVQRSHHHTSAITRCCDDRLSPPWLP